MGERVSLVRERGPSDRGWGGLVVLLLLATLGLATRPLWSPAPRSGVVVEVVGDVDRPGFHLLQEATVAAAVDASGGRVDAVHHGMLTEGDVVVVSGGGVRIAPASDPLLVGLPVDLNVHGADALAAIPGVGLRLADAIVADRSMRGSFHSVEEVARVEGVGEGMATRLRPFVTVGDVEPASPGAPLDLNLCDQRSLEALPGIGPKTAEAIVADRARRGRFETVGALQRVRGVGPATVSALRERLIVRPAP